MSRPRSSYAYPRLWQHVGDLGMVPSHRAIKALERATGFKPSYVTLSKKFVETKCHFDRPCLWDYGTAHDIVNLISHAREGQSKSPLNPKDELIHFNHVIENLAYALDAEKSGLDDPTAHLAAASNFTTETITLAANGKLLPIAACNNIVSAAFACNLKAASQLRVRPTTGKIGDGAPLNDSSSLKIILATLANHR